MVGRCTLNAVIEVRVLALDPTQEVKMYTARTIEMAQIILTHKLSETYKAILAMLMMAMEANP